MKYSLLVLEIVLATAAVAISMDPSDIPPGRGLGTAGSPNNTAFLRTPDGLHKPRPRCIRAGGFCVRRGRKCNGITDRRQCIGKKYKCCVERNACSHWSYPSTNWPLICPAYCSGIRQSPINIVTLPKLPIASGLFALVGYGSPIPTIDIKNNGHTVTVSWDTETYPCSILGGGLGGDYTLAQFHFHWGCDNFKGSEHTVDGYRYPMEMHFVHYKTSYGNLTNALKYIDGLAVLGVLFEVGAENAALEPITGHLSDITTPDAGKQDIPFGVELIKLLPGNNNFYRYRGSLTTPTCNEVVIWSVFKDKLQVSQDQLDAFRNLEDLHGDQLCDNYRYVQPLNGRIVHEY